MQETENYKLKKPDKKEFYDIGIFNDNADVIDRELANIKNNLIEDVKKTTEDIKENIKNIDLIASKVTIQDTENNFESDNVEDALKEIKLVLGDNIFAIDKDIKKIREVL